MNRRHSDGPPKAFVSFTRQFPKVGEAWALLSEAGGAGPLDAKTARLVKLGIHIATRSEGGTHAAVRKAVMAGADREEIYQVVALTTSALGLPSSVAAFTWVQEELKRIGSTIVRRSRRRGK